MIIVESTRNHRTTMTFTNQNGQLICAHIFGNDQNYIAQWAKYLRQGMPEDPFGFAVKARSQGVEIVFAYGRHIARAADGRTVEFYE